RNGLDRPRTRRPPARAATPLPRRELSAPVVPLTPRESRAWPRRFGPVGQFQPGGNRPCAVLSGSERGAEGSDPQRLPIGGDAATLAGMLAPHVGAPAEELLHLALIGVGPLGAVHDRREPLVLGQLLHRLARRVAVAEAGGLEQP